MKYEQHVDETNPVYLDETSRLMYKIVKLVYMDSLTQRQVVKELKRQGTYTSIPSVSRLLQKAHDEGVVTYKLKFPRIFNIENDLRDKLGLLEARVIYLPDSHPKEVAAALGPVAAEYLRGLFSREQDDEKPSSIGIAGGMTIFQMINSLSEQPWDVDIYTISIEPLNELEITSSVNAALLRQKCPNSRAYSLQLPVSAQCPPEELETAVKDILNYRSALEMFNKAQQADILFTGIGDFSEESRIAQASKGGGEEIETLKSKRVVGDINLTAFDEDGNIVDCQLNRRNFGLKAEQLRKLVDKNNQSTEIVHRVVAVAGGENKKEAIRGALCGRFFNVLITDETCASYLLEHESFIMERHTTSLWNRKSGLGKRERKNQV